MKETENFDGKLMYDPVPDAVASKEKREEKAHRMGMTYRGRDGGTMAPSVLSDALRHSSLVT
jgi:hypothetical protein